MKLSKIYLETVYCQFQNLKNTIKEHIENLENINLNVHLRKRIVKFMV